MRPEFLTLLKDYVEGRTTPAAWRAWWSAHAAEVEAQYGRVTFLRLQHQGIRGVMEILSEYNVPFREVLRECPRCGKPLLTVLPGTTREEIVAFARTSRIPGRKKILEDRWMHPGQYCPDGCVAVMWNIRAHGTRN